MTSVNGGRHVRAAKKRASGTVVRPSKETSGTERRVTWIMIGVALGWIAFLVLT